MELFLCVSVSKCPTSNKDTSPTGSGPVNGRILVTRCKLIMAANLGHIPKYWGWGWVRTSAYLFLEGAQFNPQH